MDRRTFVVYIASGIVTTPLGAGAQKAASPPLGSDRVTRWPPSANSPNPPAAGELAFIQITDAQAFPNDIDGPTWLYANRALYAAWNNPGGDWRDASDVAQGSNHYATTTVSGIGDIAIDAKALVVRLLSKNTGIYIKQTAGNVKFAARTHPTLPGPRLNVVTTAGTFNPPCIADTWIHPSAGLPLGGQTDMDSPSIVRFDLSSIKGTVRSATLTLHVRATFAVPCRLVVDFLDCPSIGVDTTMAAQGIAATVTQDNALARHPSVLLYDDLISANYVATHFQGVGGAIGGVANVESVRWPQYGLSAARVWSATSNQKVISWHHWAEPKQRPAQPWQRDFGDGHTHLFFRFLLEIGTDVKDGMTEQGMKLPGMTGTYDWSTSGAVTLPQPSNDGTWEARLWHSQQSAAHPDVYHLATYYYGIEHPLSKHSGAGQVRFTSGYLKAGRVHSIEQEVKLNTITNGVPNSDGVMRVWLDGVLVYENTAVGIRGYEKVRIQSIPFVNIYHGGMGMPKARFHYDIGGICVATRYIGPPRVVGAPTPASGARATALGQLAASMKPGMWAELTTAVGLQETIGVGNVGNTDVAIPFTNSMPWDPINRKIRMSAGDHGEKGGSRHLEYDDATNTWRNLGTGVGTHGFQHSAVNPHTGDFYVRGNVELFKYVDSAHSFTTHPPANIALNLSQIPAVAFVWWSGPFKGAGAHGALMLFCGNFAEVFAWDPLTDKWFMQLGRSIPGMIGQIDGVSAYSVKKNCMVFGGGNQAMGVSTTRQKIARMNADQSVTQMPDAPLPVGIYSGMNLISDYASGNFLFYGGGQLWELNPDGAGTWTRQTGTRSPPAGLLDPSTPPNSVMSVDCSTHGVVIYIDALRTRKPRVRMWIYKHA